MGFSVCHLVARESTKGDNTLFLIFTLLGCINKIVQSCIYVELSGHSSPQSQANSYIVVSMSVIFFIFLQFLAILFFFCFRVYSFESIFTFFLTVLLLHDTIYVVSSFMMKMYVT